MLRHPEDMMRCLKELVTDVKKLSTILEWSMLIKMERNHHTMESNIDEIYNDINEYYKSEQTKDIQSIISAIKSKRRLRNAYSTYSQYIAESIDKSINYTDYIAENLNQTISYSEYLSERIK